MTPLEKPLKRALKIQGADFVVTLTPLSLKVTQKGKRLGLEIQWESLVSGASALAVALQASIGRFEARAIAEKSQNAAPKPRATTRKKETRKVARTKNRNNRR